MNMLWNVNDRLIDRLTIYFKNLVASISLINFSSNSRSKEKIAKNNSEDKKKMKSKISANGTQWKWVKKSFMNLHNLWMKCLNPETNWRWQSTNWHDSQPTTQNIALYRIKKRCKIIKKKLFIFFYEFAFGYSGYWVEFHSVLLNFVAPTPTPDCCWFYSFLFLFILIFICIEHIEFGHSLEFQTKNRFPTLDHVLFIDLLFRFIYPFIWLLFIILPNESFAYVLWLVFSFPKIDA